MMKHWHTIRLGDACVTNAFSYSPKEAWTFVNYLDTGNITENRIDSIQLIDLTKEELPSRAKRKVNKDSIIYSTVRPNQRHYGIIKTFPQNFLVSTGFAVIDADTQKLDADFLYYILTQNYIVDKLHAIAAQSTSAYPSLKPSDIENLKIDIPDLDEQKAIANILRSIDEKISLNTHINRNLEQQAQAIFKSWFVDFEPFQDGKFVDSELGLIPEGWRVQNLSEISSICTTVFNPQKENILVEHYSIPAYDEDHFPVFELSFNIKSNKYLIDSNSVLVSKLNPTTKRIWKPYCLSRHSVCSTEFIVYKANDISETDYLYSIIDSQNFLDFMCAHVTGSTGSRQRTSPSATLNFKIAVPVHDIIVQFTNIVTPLYQKIILNQIQNKRLATLRDTLLPKLMSGEIDVSEVEV